MDALFSLRSHAGLPVDVLAGLTLLSIAPFAIMVTTSFLRITVVLSLVRSAIGASALPPNAVITALSLGLSCAVMAPTGRAIMHDAIAPYEAGRLSQARMYAAAQEPLRTFMQRQTQRRDLALFGRLQHDPERIDPDRPPWTVLVPAFVVNELRCGFGIGFALYLPFVAIDIAVAAILMGLGMMMLSPNVVSLPCKLLLFVLVDGWAMVCGGLVTSFR